MNSIISLTPKQLRRAADIQERILALQQELNDIVGEETGAPSSTGNATMRAGRGRRRFSASTRAKMAAAQRARWAARRGQTNSQAPAKRRVSAAVRRARSESMKARWAARKASGKSSL